MDERESTHGKGDPHDSSSHASGKSLGGKEPHAGKGHAGQAPGGNGQQPQADLKAVVDLFAQVLTDVRGNLQTSVPLQEDAQKAIAIGNQILAGLLRPGG